MNYGSVYSTQAINTPAIVTSAGTALAANPARIAFTIQNLSGANPLFVCLGATASTTVFHVILKAGTSQDDGTGGTLSMEMGAVYNGLVSVAGTSPRFVVTEMAV